MAWIRRPLKIFHMATHACCVSQRVVVVDMAIGARPWWHCVQTRERKPRTVVIERRVRPAVCAMALLAGLREIRRHVVRIRRALEILQVATHARGGGNRVVIVNVTISALPRRYCVHSREWEIG